MRKINSILWLVATIFLIIAFVTPTHGLYAENSEDIIGGIQDINTDVEKINLLTTIFDTSNLLLISLFSLIGASILQIHLNNKSARLIFTIINLVLIIFTFLKCIPVLEDFKDQTIYALYFGFFSILISIGLYLIIDILNILMLFIKK